MQSENERVLATLRETGALHDGRVTSFEIHGDAIGNVTVQLQCESSAKSAVARVRIEFEQVRRVDLMWASEDAFFLVPASKALILESGDVYVALDPDDEHTQAADNRDRTVIEAGRIRLRLEMR